MVEKVEAYMVDGVLFSQEEDAEREQAATELAYAMEPFISSLSAAQGVREHVTRLHQLRGIGRIAHDQDAELLQKLISAIKACAETE